MNKRYKDIFKGDFGIIDSICIEIENHYNENKPTPKNILINDFDFELMKIELENNIDIKYDQGYDCFVFGLKVVSSKEQPIGKFHLY